MTRRGSAQRPWTTEEIETLQELAGSIPLARIAEVLGRSGAATAKAAERLGLSTRRIRTRLVWCRECAGWRSSVDAAGRCRVCRMREQLAGREAACAEVYSRMSPEQRAVYSSEAKRGTRPSSLEPRPRMCASCPVSRYQRDRARTDYLLALEAWEHRRLELPYNAARSASSGCARSWARTLERAEAECVRFMKEANECRFTRSQQEREEGRSMENEKTGEILAAAARSHPSNGKRSCAQELEQLVRDGVSEVFLRGVSAGLGFVAIGVGAEMHGKTFREFVLNGYRSAVNDVIEQDIKRTLGKVLDVLA